jgi:hypothetical protein
MKPKDQQLLEEAYEDILKKTAYDERNPKHYEVKVLYKEVKDLANQVLGDKDMLVWDLTDEDRQKFKAYSQFGLKRVMVNKGSPNEYPAFRFGNYYRGEIWGDLLTPHTTTPNTTLKKYTEILGVLKNKAQKNI